MRRYLSVRDESLRRLRSLRYSLVDVLGKEYNLRYSLVDVLGKEYNLRVELLDSSSRWLW